jgi:hypothetical protein
LDVPVNGELLSAAPSSTVDSTLLKSERSGRQDIGELDQFEQITVIVTGTVTP